LRFLKSTEIRSELQTYMFQKLQLALTTSFESKPLRSILLGAFLTRLIAAFFSPGFLMVDDHFLTIEPAGSWANGLNYNDWLPGIGNNKTHPEGFSFFYLGFLFAFIKFFNAVGIANPATQMILVRIIHAAYSVLTVYYSYKITEKISTRKNAITVGLLLAFIAIMPNFSVRNLVEVVCMPPLLAGVFILLKHAPLKDFALGPLRLEAPVLNAPKKTSWLAVALAGMVMGLAIGIRFQTGLFVACSGAILLFQHSLRAFLAFGFMSFVGFFITQIDDVLLWGGEPFQHLRGYMEYNKENAHQYPGSPWTYFSLITIFILPPVGLFITAGFIASWRKYSIIFFPTATFIAFHLLFPNKQERFILPILPFFVIAGVIGWREISQKWNTSKWHSICWKSFWILNTIGMLVLCFTSTKKSRVETMTYLYEAGDCSNFILEYTHKASGAWMPTFYSKCKSTYYFFGKDDNMHAVMQGIDQAATATANDIMPRSLPNYVLFYDDNDLNGRVSRMQQYYPELTYRTTIEPGWFDKMLHAINPKNSLENVHIYSTPTVVEPVLSEN
jgi:hypothetical protein